MSDISSGMMGPLAQLAYGSQGSPYGAVLPLLEGILPQQSQEASEWLGFGAGVGAPTRTGALTEALSSGMKGQGEARLEHLKLRAQYLPLIMNAIVQNQQMTLSAANAGRDWLKDVMPKVDNHLAALRTNDNSPDYQQVVGKMLQLADEYQLPPQLVMAKIKGIPQGPKDLNQYLDQIAVGAAGAKELIPGIGINAAGQGVRQSGARGTISPLVGEGAPGSRAQPNEGAPGSAPLGNNPTRDFVDFYTAARGDVKTFEEGLRDRAAAYRAMIVRMNEQADLVKQFQAGRYAPQLGGVAAAVKDIGSRLPGIDPEVVKELANKLVGAKEGSAESVAAMQMYEQLAQQEVMAQLKTALGPNQRMNMMEYANFSKSNLGKALDPQTFKGLRDFYMSEAANSINQYMAWADYLKNPDVKRHTVTDFDARWNADEFKKLMEGRRGVTTPGETRPQLAAEPAPPGAMPPAPKPAAAAPTNVDLRSYEPGAKVGPTGKVYVIEKGVPRPARMKTETPAPKGPPIMLDVTPTRSVR